MTSPQFRRKPGRNDPVSKDELRRKCEAWQFLLSQLDDHVTAENHRAIRRALNRLHYSVEQIRHRHGIDHP